MNKKACFTSFNQLCKTPENILLAMRDPVSADNVNQRFWLNRKSGELFEFTQESWVSITKEYLKNNYPEHPKDE